MLFKNLQFAFRNLKRTPAISLLNILGLSTGICASLIIFMIAAYHNSYDKWEPDNQDIYRLYTYSGQDDINSGVTTALPAAISASIAGVKTVTHFLSMNGNISARVAQNQGAPSVYPNVSGIVFSDDAFFSIFPHRWLAGSPSAALSDPGKVVLSKSMATLFFPGKTVAEIIGLPIVFADSIQVAVAGVVDDLARKSDFDFKVFLSYPTITHSAKLKRTYGWGQWGHVSYLSNCVVKLHRQVGKQQIEAQLKKLNYEHNKPDPGMHGDEPKLLPLKSNHFATDVDGVIAHSTITNLNLVGWLILILAMINYINLATSSASLRAKEIGVRKVLGGNASHIKRLFLTETLLVTVIAALLGVALLPFFIKGLGSYVPSGFAIKDVLTLKGCVFLMLMTIIVTLAAGFYPALILSRFAPAGVLKAKGKGNQGATVRKGLIVTQFVIAQVLLIFVVIVGKQINYSLTTDLGYQREDGLISFYVPGAQPLVNNKKFDLIKSLHGLKGVAGVSLSSNLPTSAAQRISVAAANINGVQRHFKVWTLTGDSNFIPLFKIPIIAGKNLGVDTLSKIMPVLVNASLAVKIGCNSAAEAVNKIIDYDGDKVQIRGVMNDFHINSVKSRIPPLIYYYDTQSAADISVLLNGNVDDWHTTIGKIQSLFAHHYPDNLFNYRFFDQSIERLYRNDIAISHTLKWATGFAIFISLMGLVGLVSFTVHHKTKEIGIRKVLGASLLQVITLLSRNFLQLVLWSCLIALPVAWYICKTWLEGFAYRTALNWWIFLVAVLATLCLSFLVLYLRTYKAAKTNPVVSLKEE